MRAQLHLQDGHVRLAREEIEVIAIDGWEIPDIINNAVPEEQQRKLGKVVINSSRGGVR